MKTIRQALRQRTGRVLAALFAALFAEKPTRTSGRRNTRPPQSDAPRVRRRRTDAWP